MHTSMTHAPRRGSAILVTVLITVCLSIIIFSILQLGMFERRMNHQDRLMAQARYAAESVVENACAQVVNQLKLNSWLASDYFNTKAAKFTYSAPPADTYAGTNIVTASVELKVPDMTTIQTLTVPQESPDSLRGRSVEIRRLALYGKATARDDSGREATAYCTETLQIRGQSPATNMAFYNMDLELANGPEMTITGPVFCNKNIYFATNDGLYVNGLVATAGTLNWGRKVLDSLEAWTVAYTGNTGKVRLTSGYTAPANASDEGTYALQDFYNAGKYSDSVKSTIETGWNSDKWKTAEGNLFKGFVQTNVDGITERSLPGIQDLANAHVVIESPIKDGATGYNKNAELQKFSNKAGIIIRPVAGLGGTTKRTTKSFTRTTPTNGTPSTTYGTPSAPVTTGSAQTAGASIWAYVKEGEQSGTYEGPFTREDATGTPQKYYLMDITSKVPTFSSILTVNNSTATSGANAGFYDEREDAWITIHTIDVAQLKAAVADTSNTELRDAWNGILYIDRQGYDTPTETTENSENITNTTTARNGTITETGSLITTKTTSGRSGIMLINGSLGNLPLIPNETSDKQGFTLATNDPLYIKGDFNADGNINTGNPSSNRAPDSDAEVMACIAADAITVLSDTWNNALSYNHSRDERVPINDIEISAVFMTGIVSSVANSSYSGGLNNFPRFLEKWGPSDATALPFCYRGSMLAFFESRRATGKFSTSYYKPPKRIWGWDKRLETGRKVYGLGRVITFRRTGFSEIAGGTYESKTAGL
jgi:hypothetical protein